MLFACNNGNNNINQETETNLTGGGDAVIEFFDDYYTYQYINANTIAISEPNYYQRNVNYLIIGDASAILFDSGPGERNILPIVEWLTALPVTAAASHLHFDHIGNHTLFAEIALIDTLELRNSVDTEGLLLPTEQEFLGYIDGLYAKPLHVTQWWKDNGQIDIGKRMIEPIYIPGHTENSMALFDQQANLLFVGDFLYPGNVLVANIDAYISSSQKLMDIINEETVILAAHADSTNIAPVMLYTELQELHSALLDIKNETLQSNGSGFCGDTFPVNSRINIELCNL